MREIGCEPHDLFESSAPETPEKAHMLLRIRGVAVSHGGGTGPR
jgi:hypothetical protein